MKRYIIILTVLTSVFFTAQAQKETLYWYFGNKTGLDFTEVLDSTKPLTTVPKVIIKTPFSAYAGCFALSKEDGTFMMSSNGVYVYDKKGNAMLLKDGSTAPSIGGSDLTSQAGIAIPRPNFPTQYYVIAVPTRNKNKLIAYSIVDMSLGETGRLTMVGKSLSLGAAAKAPYNYGHESVYENIASVRHRDKKSFWIVQRMRNLFLAWLVTKDGIDKDPIISVISGTSMDDPGITTGREEGYLKFSPDGSKLAHAAGSSGYVTIGNFNTFSGEVTDIKSARVADNNITVSTPLYGLEFSPSGEYIFVGQRADAQANIDNKTCLRVILSDLTGPVKSYLTSSEFPTALQMGPDHKIYGVSGSTSFYNNSTLGANIKPASVLWVLENPNKGPLCTVTAHKNFFYANTDPAYLARHGLPSFIASFFAEITIKGKQEPCEKIATTYTADVISGTGDAAIKYILWEIFKVGDKNPIKTERDDDGWKVTNKSSITYSFEQSGYYTVKLSPYNSSDKVISGTVQSLDIIAKSCGDDTKIEGDDDVCMFDKNNIIKLKALKENPDISYVIWDFGDGSALVKNNTFDSNHVQEQPHLYTRRGEFIAEAVSYKADSTKLDSQTKTVKVHQCFIPVNRNVIGLESK